MVLKNSYSKREASLERNGFTSETFNVVMRGAFLSYLQFSYPVANPDKTLSEQDFPWPIEDIIGLMRHKDLKKYLTPLLGVWQRVFDPTLPRISADELPVDIATPEWLEKNKGRTLFCAGYVIEELKEYAASNGGDLPSPAHSLGRPLDSLFQRSKTTMRIIYGYPSSRGERTLSLEDIKEFISIPAVADRLKQSKLFYLYEATVNGTPVSDDMKTLLTLNRTELDFVRFGVNVERIKNAFASGRNLTNKEKYHVVGWRIGILALLHNEEDPQNRKTVHSDEHLSLLMGIPHMNEWIEFLGLPPVIEQWRNGEEISQKTWDEVNRRRRERMLHINPRKQTAVDDEKWFETFGAFSKVTAFPTPNSNRAQYTWWTGQKLTTRYFLTGLGKKEFTSEKRIKALATVSIFKEWMESVNLWDIWVSRQRDVNYVATAAEKKAVAVSLSSVQRFQSTWEEKLQLWIGAGDLSGYYQFLAVTSNGDEVDLCNFIKANCDSFKKFVLENKTASRKIVNAEQRDLALKRGRKMLDECEEFKKWAAVLKLIDLFEKREKGKEVTEREVKEAKERIKKNQYSNAKRNKITNRQQYTASKKRKAAADAAAGMTSSLEDEEEMFDEDMLDEEMLDFDDIDSDLDDDNALLECISLQKQAWEGLMDDENEAVMPAMHAAMGIGGGGSHDAGASGSKTGGNGNGVPTGAARKKLKRSKPGSDSTVASKLNGAAAGAAPTGGAAGITITDGAGCSTGIAVNGMAPSLTLQYACAPAAPVTQAGEPAQEEDEEEDAEDEQEEIDPVAILKKVKMLAMKATGRLPPATNGPLVTSSGLDASSAAAEAVGVKEEEQNLRQNDPQASFKAPIALGALADKGLCEDDEDMPDADHYPMFKPKKKQQRVTGNSREGMRAAVGSGGGGVKKMKAPVTISNSTARMIAEGEDDFKVKVPKPKRATGNKNVAVAGGGTGASDGGGGGGKKKQGAIAANAASGFAVATKERPAAIPSVNTGMQQQQQQHQRVAPEQQQRQQQRGASHFNNTTAPSISKPEDVIDLTMDSPSDDVKGRPRTTASLNAPLLVREANGSAANPRPAVEKTKKNGDIRGFFPKLNSNPQ
jgi:hypothetical protein